MADLEGCASSGGVGEACWAYHEGIYLYFISVIRFLCPAFSRGQQMVGQVGFQAHESSMLTFIMLKWGVTVE